MDEQGPPTVPLPTDPPPPPPVSPTAPTEPLPRDIVTPRGPRGPQLDPKKLLIAVGALIVLGVGVFGAIQLTKDDAEPAAVEPVTEQPTDPKSDDSVKAEFIRLADRLCAQANSKISSMVFPDNAAEAGAYFARSGKVLRKLVQDIKRLERPAADRKLLGKMFGTLNKLIDGSSQLAALAATGDTLALEAVTEKLERINHKANGLALKYGLITCGEPT